MNSKQTEPSADRSQLEQAYSLMMDTEIRGMFRVDPMAAAKELKARGQPILDLHGVEEIKVVTATRGKMYVPLPRIDGDYLLSDDQLDQITAAGSASTVMCASTAGTLSSVTSTAATFSSAGCAGTAGTAT